MTDKQPGRITRDDTPPEYTTAADGTQLLLIRHGETDWNRDRRIQGQTDVSLNQRGLEQATHLSRRLSREPINVIYSSDLKRAVETAAPLAAALSLPVRTSPLLREVSFGAWEGLSVAEVAEGWPAEYAAWREDSVRSRPPEGERIEDLQQRSVACVTEIIAAHPGETIAIVGHGGSVRSILCGMVGIPLSAWRRLHIDNSSISRLLIVPRGPTLLVYNDTCHLNR